MSRLLMRKDEGSGSMENEKITKYNSGIAEITVAWLFALAMLIILVALSFV